VKCADCIVVGILRHVCAGEGQVGATHCPALVGLRGERKDDAVGSTTTAGKRPVKIGIVLAVDDQVLACTSDNFPLECLVST
jgi:hypothetical protein